MDNPDIRPFSGNETEDLQAMKLLYEKYYAYLCTVAEHIVKDAHEAEEIVSDVFLKLWKLRNDLVFSVSIKAYLNKAVRNTSLNYIEKSKARKHKTDFLSDGNIELLAWDSDYPLGQFYEQELKDLIESSIKALPDGCREVFLLSRNTEMTYADIASELGISVNTVKTQMKIALSKLRNKLRDHIHKSRPDSE
jgi:RNA polymerase sigma-70 factor (ECF subfamily)